MLLAEVAREIPDLTFVINHIAIPKEKDFDLWTKGMTEIAKTTKNVHLKLSGLSNVEQDWVENIG